VLQDIFQIGSRVFKERRHRVGLGVYSVTHWEIRQLKLTSNDSQYIDTYP
jgi:hypothetical protein